MKDQWLPESKSTLTFFSFLSFTFASAVCRATSLPEQVLPTQAGALGLRGASLLGGASLMGLFVQIQGWYFALQNLQRVLLLHSKDLCPCFKQTKHLKSFFKTVLRSSGSGCVAQSSASGLHHKTHTSC